MLHLSVKLGGKIFIEKDGESLEVLVTKKQSNEVILSFEGSRDFKILRQKIKEKDLAREALESSFETKI